MSKTTPFDVGEASDGSSCTSGPHAFAVLGLPVRAVLERDILDVAYATKHKECLTRCLRDQTPVDICYGYINRAYKVLHDPISRAELVVHVRGGEGDVGGDLSPQDLMHYFSLQEEVEACEGEGLQTMCATLAKSLTDALEGIDRASDTSAMTEALTKARYVSRLITTLKRKLDEIL
ncbi:MAG: hypothetical protein H6849_00265 [Alphaproteobacteria bacterium]|nr:MAG: hypothetical protein H6849_00265 [Alphaproteobacteria bacterium]